MSLSKALILKFTSLVIEHNVWVTTKEVFEIKDIDSGYMHKFRSPFGLLQAALFVPPVAFGGNKKLVTIASACRLQRTSHTCVPLYAMLGSSFIVSLAAPSMARQEQ